MLKYEILLFKTRWVSEIKVQIGLFEYIVQIGRVIAMNTFKDFNGQAQYSIHW